MTTTTFPFRNPRSPSSLSGWRLGVVVAIKAVHSVIFLVNSASVMLIFWTGVSGQRCRWTGPALAAALSETVVFLVNHGRCPLTGLVERIGATDGRVSDIFLPRWFADRIPLIFGPQLAVGVAMLAWRRWSHGRGQQTPTAIGWRRASRPAGRGSS